MRRCWGRSLVGFVGCFQLILQALATSQVVSDFRAVAHSLTPRSDKPSHSAQRPITQQPRAVKRGLVDTRRLRFPSSKRNQTGMSNNPIDGKLSSKLVSYYESFPYYWDSSRRSYAPRFTPHLTFYKDWSRKGVTRTSVPPRANSRTSPARGWTTAALPQARASVSRDGSVHSQGAIGMAAPKPGLGPQRIAVNREKGPGDGALAQRGAYRTSMATPRAGAPVSSEKSPGAAYQPSAVSAHPNSPPVATNTAGSQTRTTNMALGKSTLNNGQTANLAAAQNPVVPQSYSVGLQRGIAHSGAGAAATLKSGAAALNRAVALDFVASQKSSMASPPGNVKSGVWQPSQNAATAVHRVAAPNLAASQRSPAANNIGGKLTTNSAPPKTGSSVTAPRGDASHKSVLSQGGANSGNGVPRGYNGGNHQGYATGVNNNGPSRAEIEPPPVPLLQNKPQSGQNSPDTASKARQVEAAKPAGGLGPALAAASWVQSPAGVAFTKGMSGNARGIQQTPAARTVSVGRENAPLRADHAPSPSYALLSNRFQGNQAVVRGSFNAPSANRLGPGFTQQRVYQRGYNRPKVRFQGNAPFHGKGNFRYGTQVQGPRTAFPGKVLPNGRISTRIPGNGPVSRPPSYGMFRGRPVSTEPQRAVGQRNIITRPQTWRNSQRRTNGMAVRLPSYRAAVPRQHSHPIFLYKHSPGSQVKRNLKRTIQATGESAAKARRRLLELRRK